MKHYYEYNDIYYNIKEMKQCNTATIESRIVVILIMYSNKCLDVKNNIFSKVFRNKKVLFFI